VYWNGATPNVCVADVNVVRQVLFDRTGLYPKNLMNPHVTRLLGKGLVLTDGDDWKRHRKVVHPAFNMDKLKVCVPCTPHSVTVTRMLRYFLSSQTYYVGVRVWEVVAEPCAFTWHVR
jgi:hypothetical protein